jgi:hypothetical protein
VTAEQFCALKESAFAAAPAWDYRITDHSPRAAQALATSPNLLRLEKLAFWTSKPPTAAEILGSPYLRNVRALALGFGSEWVKELPALAANAAAENLAQLDIHEGFDDAAAAALASSPAFARLQVFRAFHHELTPKGLRTLFRSPHLTNLTELTLPGWYREEGARAIAQTRPRFRLRKLVMYGAWMTDAGVELIANWPGLESVRALEIDGECEVLGPRALASSPHARNLRELDLGLSRLNRAGALALARSKTLNLKRLLIRSTPAGDDETAVAALVKRFGKDAVKVRYPGQRKKKR